MTMCCFFCLSLKCSCECCRILFLDDSFGSQARPLRCKHPTDNATCAGIKKIACIVVVVHVQLHVHTCFDF